jgi:hypothetical protein
MYGTGAVVVLSKAQVCFSTRELLHLKENG